MDSENATGIGLAMGCFFFVYYNLLVWGLLRSRMSTYAWMHFIKPDVGKSECTVESKEVISDGDSDFQFLAISFTATRKDGIQVTVKNPKMKVQTGKPAWDKLQPPCSVPILYRLEKPQECMLEALVQEGQNPKPWTVLHVFAMLFLSPFLLGPFSFAIASLFIFHPLITPCILGLGGIFGSCIVQGLLFFRGWYERFSHPDCRQAVISQLL